MRGTVEFKHVSKQYDTGGEPFYALQDANLTIPEGEFVVILGPSGAGKSTLLNLLGGMDTVTEGEIIFFDGQKVSDMNDRELTAYRAREVGIVFQFYNLIPSLTAYENVALMRDIKSDLDDPAEVLEKVGLAERMNHFPAQLSGGEQQRVSIARALVKRPRLLICDEPTGALDTKTGQEVLKLLADLCHSGGKTVVMVTHNSLFADMADRVIRVKNGRVEGISVNEHPLSADEIVW